MSSEVGPLSLIHDDRHSLNPTSVSPPLAGGQRSEKERRLSLNAAH